MTDYADLEKRLRESTKPVAAAEGIFTTYRAVPLPLCIEAADALASLTRELEEAKTLVALALDRLEDVDDVGPRDEGWQSAELMEWIANTIWEFAYPGRRR